MKILIIMLVMVGLSVTDTEAQCNRFFQFTQGQLLEYTSFNRKGKEVSREKQKISHYAETADGFEVEFSTESFDKKGKSLGTTTLSGACANGVYTFDVRNLLNDEMTQAFSSMEVTMEGTPLEIPDNLEVGQELPPGDFTVKTTGGPALNMNMSFAIDDRKVIGKESVTTTAGTFDCYIIEQSIEMKFLFNKKYKSREYLSEKFGSIRIETLNKNEEIVSTRDLTAKS